MNSFLSLNSFLLGPIPWHVLIITLASAQVLLRLLMRQHRGNPTLWDMGVWLILFASGILPLFADNFWAAWLQYLVLSLPLFGLGMWYCEKVLQVQYNEGAIAHLFGLYIYIAMSIISVALYLIISLAQYFLR